MTSISGVKAGNAIIYNGQIWTVVKMNFVNPGKGSAFYTIRLKNIKTGNVNEVNIKSSVSVEMADVTYFNAQYLYKDGDNYNFMDNDSFNQFSFHQDTLGEQTKYLQEEKEYKIMYIDNQPVGLELPPKVELKVISSPPAVKGNTATNATKEVTLETGLTVKVPLFIKENDIVRVNTETGQYTERVANK